MGESGKGAPPTRLERIDVADLQQLYSWSRALGVTPDELKALVERVGPLASTVRRAVSDER